MQIASLIFLCGSHLCIKFKNQICLLLNPREKISFVHYNFEYIMFHMQNSGALQIGLFVNVKMWCIAWSGFYFTLLNFFCFFSQYSLSLIVWFCVLHLQWLFLVVPKWLLMLSLETESADWTGYSLLEQCPASLLTLPVLLNVRVILSQSQTVLQG